MSLMLFADMAMAAATHQLTVLVLLVLLRHQCHDLGHGVAVAHVAAAPGIKQTMFRVMQVDKCGSQCSRGSNRGNVANSGLCKGPLHVAL